MAVFQPIDFLHPLDRAARQQLEGIPLLRNAVKKYLEHVSDRRWRNWLLSNAMRLSPNQLGDYYRLLPPICQAFGIETPELYLMRGAANAMTVGHTKSMIVLYHGLLEDLADDEIQAVIAHECGHILCDHLLYRQMSLALLTTGEGILTGTIGAAANIASAPLQMALANWCRKSELTANRAAAAFMRSPDPMQRALFHLIGVPKWFPGDINYPEFAAQSDEFDALATASKWDRFLIRSMERGSSHPIPTIRIRELTSWTAGDTFRTLTADTLQDRRLCQGCGSLLGVDWRFCQKCGSETAPAIAAAEGTE